MKKVGVISIVGRPSVGKSSLLNRICGEHISIVAKHPQTTRSIVRGILNDERGQLIFLDTPGYHRSERAYNAMLRKRVRSSLDDCDCVLYVLDVLRLPQSEEYELLSVLLSQSLPVVLAYNKCDLADSARLRGAIRKRVGEEFLWIEIDVSAETGQGSDALVCALFERAEDTPEAELPYPANVYSDQSPDFRIAELIREQAILRARKELPHAIRVDIQDMEIRGAVALGAAQSDQAEVDERERGKAQSEARTAAEQQGQGSRLWIRAQICVESESQVSLVVGKAGAGIRDIRKASQRSIARFFPYRIDLDLRVKSIGKWRKASQREKWE